MRTFRGTAPERTATPGTLTALPLRRWPRAMIVALATNDPAQASARPAGRARNDSSAAIDAVRAFVGAVDSQVGERLVGQRAGPRAHRRVLSPWHSPDESAKWPLTTAVSPLE